MKTLLKLEELAEALFAVFVFVQLPYAWWVLPAACLLPDLSMLGYLAGPRVGAVTYNIAHHRALAFFTGVTGYYLGDPLWMLVGTVLLFHSAVDRVVGYGLKYGSGFKDTHLGQI